DEPSRGAIRRRWRPEPRPCAAALCCGGRRSVGRRAADLVHRPAAAGQLLAGSRHDEGQLRVGVHPAGRQPCRPERRRRHDPGRYDGSGGCRVIVGVPLLVRPRDRRAPRPGRADGGGRCTRADVAGHRRLPGPARRRAVRAPERQVEDGRAAGDARPGGRCAGAPRLPLPGRAVLHRRPLRHGRAAHGCGSGPAVARHRVLGAGRHGVVGGEGPWCRCHAGAAHVPGGGAGRAAARRAAGPRRLHRRVRRAVQRRADGRGLRGRADGGHGRCGASARSHRPRAAGRAGRAAAGQRPSPGAPRPRVAPGRGAEPEPGGGARPLPARDQQDRRPHLDRRGDARRRAPSRVHQRGRLRPVRRRAAGPGPACPDDPEPRAPRRPRPPGRVRRQDPPGGAGRGRAPPGRVRRRGPLGLGESHPAPGAQPAVRGRHLDERHRAPSARRATREPPRPGAGAGPQAQAAQPAPRGAPRGHRARAADPAGGDPRLRRAPAPGGRPQRRATPPPRGDGQPFPSDRAAGGGHLRPGEVQRRT
ncbi:MAG: hypothetical protein AVDCRST_MAG47-901, partial [uncultured Nocardioidaceae bacterium]